LRWRAVGSPVPRLRVNLFVVLLLSGVVIGLLVTPARWAGVESAGKLLAGVTALYVVHDVFKTRAELWRAAGALVGVGILMVLIVPFSVSWTADKVYTLPSFLDWTLRPPGEGTNPNIVAAVIVLTFPLAVALLWAPGRLLRWLGASALGPLAVGLLVLQARGAWFALPGGFAIGAAFYRRWLLPLVPLLLLAALALNQSLGGGDRLSDIVYGKVGTRTSGTLMERQAMWAQAVELLRGHPLTGIGLGAYPFVAPYAPPYSLDAPALVQPHAHNVFLQVALDTGLLGLAGFCGVWGLAALAAWRAWSRRVAAPLPLGILAAFGVALVHSLGDATFWGLKAGWALWCLFGLALAAGSTADETELEKPGRK
jgi:putative inorganic carbon (HCO3(-)) transporter